MRGQRLRRPQPGLLVRGDGELFELNPQSRASRAVENYFGCVSMGSCPVLAPGKFIMFKPHFFGKALSFAALFFLLQTASVFSATWYVATNGVDSNAGTSNSPFATIMRAQTVASSGDTVYLRGGTYYLNNSNLTLTNSPVGHRQQHHQERHQLHCVSRGAAGL